MLVEAITCLALNIYFEARGEPHDGQVAVAQVTMNRVASNRYPDTTCGVVWQNKQFSWTHDGKSDRPKDKQALKQALEIARDAHKNSLPDLIGQATHYHSTKVLPYWAKDKQPIAVIGNHKFYEGIK